MDTFSTVKMSDLIQNPSQHVMTGNHDIASNNSMRGLLMRGPNNRAVRKTIMRTNKKIVFQRLKIRLTGKWPKLLRR